MIDDCGAEALHHALQQQTPLNQSGCTLGVTPNLGANLAKPSATLPGRDHAGTASEVSSADLGQNHKAGLRAAALSGPKTPLLIMSSRGAKLLVVSVQLKTGYMRVSSGDMSLADKEMTQLLRQVRQGCQRQHRTMLSFSGFVIHPLQTVGQHGQHSHTTQPMSLAAFGCMSFPYLSCRWHSGLTITVQYSNNAGGSLLRHHTQMCNADCHCIIMNSFTMLACMLALLWQQVFTSN